MYSRPPLVGGFFLIQVTPALKRVFIINSRYEIPVGNYKYPVFLFLSAYFNPNQKTNRVFNNVPAFQWNGFIFYYSHL